MSHTHLHTTFTLMETNIKAVRKLPLEFCYSLGFITSLPQSVGLYKESCAEASTSSPHGPSESFCYISKYVEDTRRLGYLVLMACVPQEHI